jgi:hypothetical protein
MGSYISAIQGKIRPQICAMETKLNAGQAEFEERITNMLDKK